MVGYALDRVSEALNEKRRGARAWEGISKANATLNSHEDQLSMAKNKSHKSAAAARQSLPMNKLKKDPGVPKLNLKQKQLVKITAQSDRAAPIDAMRVDTTPSLAGLAASVSIGTADEDFTARLQVAASSSADPTLAAHAHQFKKVLETADVLDARDPLGCRSKIVEEEVLRSGGEKKIILVLNKTDLVPKENVLAWLKYLRNDFPTIPFKSSTQQQRTHLSNSTTSKSSSKGAPHLLHLLKAIRPAHQSITVGVLGPPNVGKSSLINSLKRQRVCTVGAKPGETRALKEVAVERGIKVIDSPGIIWGDAEEGGAFRNVWSLEGLEDPSMVVEGIVSRVPAEVLQQMYGTPPFKDAAEMLLMIALVRGKLGKGGKPDMNSAALMVVHDWNIGKIPFHTVPPAVHPSMISRTDDVMPGDDAPMDGTAPLPAAYASTSIVKEWGKAFDLDGLWASADNDVLGDGEGDAEEMQVEEEAVEEPSEIVVDDETPLVQQPDRHPKNRLKRPASPSEASMHTADAKQTRERRPAKKPKERTQRLAPKGADELDATLLMATSNPLNRKKLKLEAKKRRREGRKLEIGEDLDMQSDD